MDIEETRKQCGQWAEDIGCLLDYPEDCPYSGECSEEESSEEEKSD